MRKSPFVLVAMLVIITSNVSFIYAGEIIYVDAGAVGNNDGSSWDDAFSELQSGLNAAMFGDEIWLATGIYKPDYDVVSGIHSGDRGATFQLVNGVTIKGGYAGSAKAGMVAHWKLDENTDTTAYDSAGSNDGTLMGGTGWTGGQFGGALDFDGVDDYVQILHDAGLNPDADSWSTSFWMRSDTASQSAFIISKRAESVPYPQYSIGLSAGNSYAWPAGSKITFLFREAAGIEKGGYTTSDIDFSDWTHVGIVLNRSASTVHVYINGISVPVTMDHDDALPTINNNSPLYIGGNPSVSGLYYQGQIDDVRFFDEPLSENRMSVLAGLDIPDPNERNIQLYDSILSGDLNGDDVTIYNPEELLYESSRFENSYHVTTGSGTDATAFLDGVSVLNGHADGDDSGYLSSADYGGGMFNDAGSPTIVNCTFGSNTARSYGGGIFNKNDSNPTLLNCIFIANSATDGGGMDNEESNPTLTNCLFSGNAACSYNADGGQGGAMYNYASNPTLTNCTFAGNTADEWGSCGGIRNYSNCEPTLTNCVLWGNDTPQISGSAVVSHSNVEGGFLGDNNIDIDPLFVDADGADNVAGTKDDDLRLSDDSLCINSGSNAAVPLSVVTDLDGNSRIVDNTVDMGAYENPDPDFFFSLNPVSLTVPEEGTATFAVALLIDPEEEVEVTVTYESGDADLTIESGGTLSFDSSNYLQPQTVTIAAADDADNLSGQGVIRVSASGFVSSTVNVSENDNDAPTSSVLFVDAGAPGVNNGSNWAEAYTELSDAISIAAMYPGVVDEIRVAQGQYTPVEPNGDRDVSFQLNNGIALRGGYAGYGAPNPDARDIEQYETILSGDLNGNDGPDFLNNDENSRTVLTCENADSTTVLDGVTIADGNEDRTNYLSIDGIGMRNTNASAVIVNCTFTRNSGPNGAGMYNIDSDLTVTNCAFTQNNATSGTGAGIYNSRSNPTFTNCTISGNTALGTSWGYGSGGGMTNSLSNPVLIDCTISGNDSGKGGGMYNLGSGPILTNCTIDGNTSTPHYDGGGGMYCGSNSSPTITDCIISNNTTIRHGGGIYCEGGSNPTVTNCQIIGNIATSKNIGGGGGGALYCDESSPSFGNCAFIENTAIWSGGAIYGGSPALTNCLFSGNAAFKGPGTMASLGGAICKTDGPITNCTIVGNSVDETGGAMYECFGPITNCIIWGNTAAISPQLHNSSAPTYSCIQDWTGGGIYNISSDPLLVDPPNGNHHLLPDSLCIDAGNPSSAWGNEPLPNGARINIGAYGNTSEATTSRAGLQLSGFNIISKTRVGRTTFQYVLSLSLTNITLNDMTDITIKLIDADEQVVSVTDDEIFFPIIAAESTPDSDTYGDYFIIDVNRSALITAGRVTWQIDYTTPASPDVQMMSFDITTLDTVISDLTGEGIVDIDDLLIMMRDWLQGDSIADIYQDDDNIVNLKDFAVLAEHWLSGTLP